VSLSQDPAFSTLKKYFVCGYTDITNQAYAGVSGFHERQGNAVNTTNGAGPHNIQMFILSPDGTVLHCLPGYWDPRDLSRELAFAYQVNKVWTDQSLRQSEKNQLFSQMQLEHIGQHPPQMVARSRMQGFDQKYEAEHKPNSDTIVNHKAVSAYAASGWQGHMPAQSFKTTDVIMHERMAKRPFLAFTRFDTADFSDYGKPMYDKNEDEFDARSGKKMADAMYREKRTIGDSSHYDMKNKTGYQSTEPALWGASK